MNWFEGELQTLAGTRQPTAVGPKNRGRPDPVQRELNGPNAVQDLAWSGFRCAPCRWGFQSRKRILRRRLYGRTKPGTLLKHHIPIKTDHWDVTRPGFTEIDLVSHSGDCAEGEFAHSFNLTDIHTTWTETRAVLGKGETGIVAALEEMRQALPFALAGIDSDNGSEFLNHHLVRYCRTEQIQLTRGRPYKKDDNAHIEQKNWTCASSSAGTATTAPPPSACSTTSIATSCRG